MRLSYDNARYRAQLADRFGVTKAAGKLRLSTETVARARAYVREVEATFNKPKWTFEQWHSEFSKKQEIELEGDRALVKALKAYYLYRVYLNSPHA